MKICIYMNFHGNTWNWFLKWQFPQVQKICLEVWIHGRRWKPPSCSSKDIEWTWRTIQRIKLASQIGLLYTTKHEIPERCQLHLTSLHFWVVLYCKQYVKLFIPSTMCIPLKAHIGLVVMVIKIEKYYSAFRNVLEVFILLQISISNFSVSLMRISYTMSST